MTQVTVTTSPTKLASAGNRRYLHIFNNSSQPVYVCYDGATDPAGTGTGLTTANGAPIPVGGFLFLDNDSMRNHYNDDVYAVVASATADVRIQGV